MSTGRVIGIVFLTAVLVVVAIGAGAFIYLKQHRFTARTTPPKAEIYMADLVRQISAPATEKNLSDPLPVTPENTADGSKHYAHDCAVCHGPDGTGKTEIGRGLYPPIPNLTSNDTQSMTDAEIYDTIRNGIPFSGMPAFEGTDPSYWRLVQFIRHLPKMTPQEIEEVRQVAANSGPHRRSD